MFIRSRDEAMDVLAEIVALPERRDQIIRSTVAIMECLDAEARTFMADCQALLIKGGLEELKQQRREIIHDTEIVAIEDPEEDREIEALASASDALRFADVVHTIFPDLVPRYRRWEIARALLSQETLLRDQIRIALVTRHESTPEKFDAARSGVESIIETCLPAWRSRAEEMLRACQDVMKSIGSDGNPELIFTAIAASDEAAELFLTQLERDPSAAIETVRHLNEWTATVRALEERKG